MALERGASRAYRPPALARRTAALASRIPGQSPDQQVEEPGDIQTESDLRVGRLPAPDPFHPGHAGDGRPEVAIVAHGHAARLLSPELDTHMQRSRVNQRRINEPRDSAWIVQVCPFQGEQCAELA